VKRFFLSGHKEVMKMRMRKSNVPRCLRTSQRTRYLSDIVFPSQTGIGLDEKLKREFTPNNIDLTKS